LDFLKILAFNNHRKIQEPVVTSILNYLLTPTEDHGFRHEFLSRYLDALNLSSKVALFKYQDRQAFWMPLDNEPPIIHVSAEFSNDPSLGRIDSLITVEKGDEVWLVGTEVKIYDESARNVAATGLQLERYAQILDNERRRYIEKNGDRGLAVIPALAYIVPGDSRTAYEPAIAGSSECARLSIHGPLVLHWNTTEGSAWEGITLCRQSVSEIVDQLLKAYVRGQISSPDAQAVDLLRSLRSAIGTDFRFRFEEDRAPGRFPDEVSYIQSLDDSQRKLYTNFVDLIKNRTGTRNPMVARKNNTTIGVPRRAGPQGAYNTLCRIRTTSSYLTGEPVKQFQIELSADVFNPKMKQLQAIIESLKITVRLSGSDSIFYHENGKEDEEVILLQFENSTRDSKEIKGDLSRIVDFLEKVFDERR